MTDLTLSSPARAAAIPQPRTILAAVALLQVLLWTVLPPLVSTSPPLDVTEGYLWGREWPLVTYKHPQLPAWLLETGHWITGSFIWPHYLISQLFIVTAFFLVYQFGRDIMGAKAGLAGALLMTTLYYCEWVSQQFNHDVAQIPFWAAIILLLWRAVERNGWGNWLLLGIVAGIGLYAKFSTGVIIGFGGLWLLADRQARSRLSGSKPWVALAVFLGVAAPLGFALYADDLLPFRYAAERTGWVADNRSIFYFVGVQIGAHAVLIVVILATGLLRFGRGRLFFLPLPALRERVIGAGSTIKAALRWRRASFESPASGLLRMKDAGFALKKNDSLLSRSPKIPFILRSVAQRRVSKDRRGGDANLNLAPMTLRSAGEGEARAGDLPEIAPRALAYLAWMALGPGVAIAIASLFVGVGEAWATPMFDLSGLVAVALLRRNFSDAVLRRMVIAAPICVVLWVAAYCGFALHLHDSGRRMAPFLIPQAAMSARLDAIWAAAVHRPLTIIGGEEDPEAMAAALSVPGEPSYFTDFSPVEAPWVTPARIAREGMMVIWPHQTDAPDAALPYLAQATQRGVEEFPWSTAEDARPVVLNYAIVPPRE